MRPALRCLGPGATAIGRSHHSRGCASGRAGAAARAARLHAGATVHVPAAGIVGWRQRTTVGWGAAASSGCSGRRAATRTDRRCASPTTAVHATGGHCCRCRSAACTADGDDSRGGWRRRAHHHDAAGMSRSAGSWRGCDGQCKCRAGAGRHTSGYSGAGCSAGHCTDIARAAVGGRRRRSGRVARGWHCHRSGSGGGSHNHGIALVAVPDLVRDDGGSPASPGSRRASNWRRA